ncbi:MAG: hypothetical protein IJU79_04745 [Desulfovibrionaceae bacterium]|nr:hypothetical protein [Desulfovibrionaceae bacterium]
MLIHEKKPFIRGSLMILSFLVVFGALLTPIFHDEHGKPLTGLQFADNVFNELSKGSSNFFPTLRDQVATLAGRNVQLTVKVKKADQAPLAVTLLNQAGAQASNEQGTITFGGDLAQILAAAVDDSEKLYHNNDKDVSAKYNGVKALDVSSAWWQVLTPSIKELQKNKMIAEAKVVDQIIRRGIETGHNFFGIEPAKVKDHVLLLTSMLVFYIIYTLWYGFSIFELFEGIGLAMTKSKVKQES